MSDVSLSSSTQAAILGQLALREWSAYELTRSMRRSVRWFWPRVESVIYAEAKRLVDDGLAAARREAAEDGSRRQRTIYTITDRGRDRLAAWLGTEPLTYTVHNEAALRVHLARFGSRDDLLTAVDWAAQVGEDLLGDAEAVAEEFVAGRHIFQDEAHIRGLLFDALAAQGLALQRWAVEARREVERWDSIAGDRPARRRAIARMQDYLRKRDRR